MIKNTYCGKRSERRVLDRENAERLDYHHLLCCWDTCDRYGLEIYKIRVNYGILPGDGITRPDLPYNTWYVFCSERHRQYWANSHRDLNNLPPGFKLGII